LTHDAFRSFAAVFDGVSRSPGRPGHSRAVPAAVIKRQVDGTVPGLPDAAVERISYEWYSWDSGIAGRT
jgi:hypothetical protein